MRQTVVLEPVRILLSESIDYAGLLPPASLEMGAAVEEYGRSMQSKFGWMLGRFVLPASRLKEFEKHLKPQRARGWRVSASIGPGFKDDLRSIVEFHLKAGERAHVDTVEFKVNASEEINPVTELLPHDIYAHVEITPGKTLADQISALKLAGLGVTIRAGGFKTGMFPTLQQMTRLIAACASNGVAFKVTAGLQHPLRGVYALTSKERSPHAPMHGFLNVLVAAAAAKAGAMELQLPELLSVRNGQAFAFNKNGVTWRTSKLTNQQLRETREQLAIGFGCISLEEPVLGLQALQLL